MSLHKEINFEVEVCQHLGSNGWLYAVGDAASYDRSRALFPADLVAWVQEAQPTAWETLSKNHGGQAVETVLARLRDQLDQRGTLDVLRNGIELLGLKQPLKLAEFKPALAMNPDILARYQANRLRVVRQVRYSLLNENCLDLVLFLNGIPVATVELKTDFTQSIKDAVDQYRFDRIPRPKGQAPEPLLSFPGGALVHFAVSNSEVEMVTRLDGPATQFLPFNQGDAGAKGNPVNPKGGHRTAYLWEQVWARESWLDILGRYLIGQRDGKKQLQSVIFPRYHQLDATRAIQAAVLAEGAGGKYLIQHSAGSGKTNSIAWTAHFLADLHDADNRKVFDTVIVVSDRTVIDSQLQEALFDFQRTTGVVATITGADSSKSAQLADALSGNKKIVVCTIQTFPFAIEAVRELAATQHKRFAVIADEAHSSQSGQTAAQLKAVLNPEELAVLADGGDVSAEDVLAAQMSARAGDAGITYVAFTATPKSKTMELFGTRPDTTRQAGPGNLPKPSHVYSMRQAIDEGFILDVLKNYTPYKLAFKLAHDGADYDEKTVERAAAVKRLMGWVKLHPYNISQKVQVVVEHFREFVAPLLNGRAKAMVVVGSRIEAVRWKLAIEKYIADSNYQFGTVVAFSGDVNDKDSGVDPFTEHSKTLNPNLRGRDIREAFKGDEYRILLVANKFQTGFDQPLLCGMYVDKRLAGIQAVQTLSRLNRAHPGKDTTYVLDFINDSAEVLEAFKTYYTTAELAATTDPNLIFNLRAKLDAAGYYDDFEVDRVVAVELKPGATQGELVAALEPVVDRLLRHYKAAQHALRAARELGDDTAAEAAQNRLNALILFKTDIGAYIRLYTFLSQMFDYGNTAIEKRAIFYKRLLPLLEFGREREGIDLSKVVLTHHTIRSLGKHAMPLGGQATKLEPLTEAGSGSVQEREKARLNEIIEKVNDLFEGELTDQDKLVYVNNVIKGKLLESEKLRQQATNNTKEQFANSPDLHAELMNAIMDALDAHTAMSTQALNSQVVQRGMKDILLNYVTPVEGIPLYSPRETSMRARTIFTVATVLVAGSMVMGQAPKRLNPMIELLAQNKPVFGLYAPANRRMGGGPGMPGGAPRPAAPPADAPAPKTADQLAGEALANKNTDFIFDGTMEGGMERGLPPFTAFVKGMSGSGAFAKSSAGTLTHPLVVKMHEIAPDPKAAAVSIGQQLNLGVTGIMFVSVESAAEAKAGIDAMRFKSNGGTRSEDVGQAPALWGVSEKDYKAKADLWPLNPNGELVNWTIIESKEGLDKVREIAAVKGLGVLWPGAGTLRGLFSTVQPDGTRKLDDAAWEASIQKVLAACKEFNVACGYPANATDIELRMKQGFSVFVMNWGDAGFKAIEVGKKAAGR